MSLSQSLHPCLALSLSSELMKVPLPSEPPPPHWVVLLNFIFPGLQLTKINPPSPPLHFFDLTSLLENNSDFRIDHKQK